MVMEAAYPSNNHAITGIIDGTGHAAAEHLCSFARRKMDYTLHH
jgi:hypothetical protein